MPEALVPVFFYGGLINGKVHQQIGLSLTNAERAIVHGYALCFEPWVNLRRDAAHHVYGLVAEVPHTMLEAVYARLAARYYPYPVLCAMLDGDTRPALSYIAPAMEPGLIDATHVENLAEGAEACGFPQDYVAMIRSFKP